MSKTDRGAGGGCDQAKRMVNRVDGESESRSSERESV